MHPVYGSIVQGIEREFPKLEIQVRVLVELQTKSLPHCGGLFSFPGRKLACWDGKWEKAVRPKGAQDFRFVTRICQVHAAAGGIILVELQTKSLPHCGGLFSFPGRKLACWDGKWEKAVRPKGVQAFLFIPQHLRRIGAGSPERTHHHCQQGHHYRYTSRHGIQYPRLAGRCDEVLHPPGDKPV